MSDGIEGPGKPLARIAVIGLGMATKPHLEALHQLRGRVDVSGIYNRTPDRAKVVRERYGFNVFDSLQSVAADPGTDCVLIATPPDARQEIVCLMADAGKHILMEKPVERTLTDAARLVALCEDRGVKTGVVFQHRMRTAARRLRQIMDEGALGELALARAEIPWWRDQAYYDEPGRGTLARDGGGVLLTQAIHVLDLLLSLTGPAASVQALTATTRLHRMEAEDFASAGVRFSGGAVGSIMATTATWPGTTERIILDCSEASAVLEGNTLRIDWRDGRSEKFGQAATTGGGADPMAFACDWHRDLIEDFAIAVAGGGMPIVSGREALRVQALIDAITVSGETRTEVAVQDV
ncbi:Gfo/Idh/MocA family protein [Algicella marina]|uniref:Gfo/Idh/MocA family oxidoreductase n=1 Tax=Algicella marina TaxID=2683284 RepID=A0A6P1SZT7_9RHOB|nr:Gfo/Idh/MocA family oxidoreductase [Algicella marina]QHQ35120.1 gfo/Idh/MocA family oxidoreductase [Algicella marina]